MIENFLILIINGIGWKFEKYKLQQIFKPGPDMRHNDKVMIGCWIYVGFSTLLYKIKVGLAHDNSLFYMVSFIRHNSTYMVKGFHHDLFVVMVKLKVQRFFYPFAYAAHHQICSSNKL